MRKKLLLTVAFVSFCSAPWGEAAPVRAAEPCRECHKLDDVPGGNRSIHLPFEVGKCTACHLDHGDDERLVLAPGGNGICAECHDFDDRNFQEKHFNMRRFGVSCLGCHNPHRSELIALLRSGRHRPLAYGRCDPCHLLDGRLNRPTVGELCLRCHGGETFSRPYGHGPVESGDCLECHDPHGSKERALLLDGYSSGRWIRNGEEDYRLCLRCHEGDSLTGEESDTAFSVGDVNFHRLHITIDRTLSKKLSVGDNLHCRNCHEVHTAPNAGLIRSELDCGGIPCLRLDFNKSPSGGECLSGCHGPKKYGDPVRRVTLPAGGQPLPPSKARPTAALTTAEKEINRRCRTCHDNEVQGFARTYVHHPVRSGNCSACHLDHGPNQTLLLIDRTDRLCGGCHTLDSSALTAAHGGYRLEGSVCTECHDPHSGGNAKFLYPREHEPFAERDCQACHSDPGEGWRLGEKVNEVCARCHDDIAGEAFLHSAVTENRCIGCHQPHAGERDLFLRADVPFLCFDCHGNENFTRDNVHSPVREGECGACHPAHGSDNRRLLARAYPEERFVSFREEAYDLCWECHDATEVAGVSTDETTGFRDGDINLHAIHLRDRERETGVGVRTSPGTSCHNCHDPHSTDQSHLIRRSLDCDGTPCLKLEYRGAGGAGSCQGGCHVTMSYHP